ncbi:inter-alpha-trypsin inhibitor heavy chain H3-like isoform X2 [Cyprinodon tularosa]|uniref:inter-alpha-trypsin inhibitor heavy chain H3-like isoform X2 n=1 Tax=Cyprinodon tularosa TaxID=77115 RepID=UPI0018E22B9E|nr:inter-alpha-trypsin inhibitor heavy chain H3-like isoform X2 [Cyprinodon tularosa]
MRRKRELYLLCLFLVLAAALPDKDDWDIYSFHINSTVTSRFATTVITSRVANRKDESKEIEFHVQIPKNAFISKFRMFIDGQVYDGIVKTKEQAQQQYTDAVSRGQSAGIVSSVGRTMEEFKTSVNVAAHKKVTFELTYEELLKRTHGIYEMQVHARPMKPVKDFKLDVYIYEKAGISFVDVKGGLSTKALANAITKTQTDEQAWVHFYPTEDQQKSCEYCGEDGMNGDLVIVYDVKRDTGLGDIKLTSDGYFVHHFAPSNLTRIPKNVVFVIDQSGSMNGKKMEQTRTALLHILNDLAENDFFGLITFDSEIFHWKRELVQATSENLHLAKEFARNIVDRGATDINGAILEGARMLNAHPREGSASILILLTDGDPTSGVTNPQRIQSNVKQAIAGKFPLYCLGFGFDVNFEFLEKMSLQNSGLARRIYQDSDADLQLKGFYEEVATPLLTDVTMIYIGGTNLTQTNFSQFYNGSEIVVAGKIIDNNIETFIPQVVAISSERKVNFSKTTGSMDSSNGTVSDGVLQRVWAYLTVKQLLEKELLLSGSEKQKVKDEALQLSLKYSFVTPLTSMVVTKPEGENTQILHKPKEGKAPQLHGLSLPPGPPGFSYAASPSHIGYAGSSSPRGRGYAGSSSPRGGGYAGSSRPRGGGYRSFPSLRVGGHGHSGLGRVLKPDMAHAPPVHPTYSSSRTRGGNWAMPPPRFAPHKFLLKMENQSQPLCFEINKTFILLLFHHPSKEVRVIGMLDAITHGGFRTILIQAGSEEMVAFNHLGVLDRRDGPFAQQTTNDNFTTGRIKVIRQPDKEFHITLEDMHLVIFVHEKDGYKFLWPVVHRMPNANNIEGILALSITSYVEVESTPLTKLRIRDREVYVNSSSAADYSITEPVDISCWLTPTDDVLEKPLRHYILYDFQ